MGLHPVLSCYNLDIDIPERGRKHVQLRLYNLLVGFRYRYPREGTETLGASVNGIIINLDIDIPERGRKQYTVFQLSSAH